MLFIICSAHHFGFSTALGCPSELGFPDSVLNCWTNTLKFSAKPRLPKCQPLSHTSSERHKAPRVSNPDKTGPRTEQALSQSEQRHNYFPWNSALLHFCFFGHNPFAGSITSACCRALGCTRSCPGPATASLPWDGQTATLARSALEKERAASCRLLSHEAPRPIRKSKGSCVQSSAVTRKPEQQREAANHLAARCGSLQQRGLRGRGARVRPCHGQGSPCCSSAEQPQAERLGSLSRPCSPNSRSSNCFAGGENSAVTYHCEARYLL